MLIYLEKKPLRSLSRAAEVPVVTQDLPLLSCVVLSHLLTWVPTTRHLLLDNQAVRGLVKAYVSDDPRCFHICYMEV